MTYLMRLNQINFEIITPEKDEPSGLNTYSAKHLCLLMYLRVARLSLMYSMICPRKSSKLSSVDFKCSTAEHLTTSTYYLYAPIKGRLNSWLPMQVLVVWVFFKGEEGVGHSVSWSFALRLQYLKFRKFQYESMSSPNSPSPPPPPPR